MPTQGCRPKPRYSAGSPAIRNFADRMLSRAQCQAEDLAFEILEIADDSSRDYVKKTERWKSDLGFDKEHFARQRLKIKALKWIMARMAPRKYGSQ